MESLYINCRPGPGRSKLTTSLVNVLLNFQMPISEIFQYVLSKNVRSFGISFFNKNINLVIKSQNT